MKLINKNDIDKTAQVRIAALRNSACTKGCSPDTYLKQLPIIRDVPNEEIGRW